MYGWGCVLLKMLRQGMDRDLYCWKSKNKEYQWFYSIENAKIRYISGFVPLKESK